MSRPRHFETHRSALIPCPGHLGLALGLLLLVLIGTIPRAARAAFDPVFRSPELFNAGGQPTCTAVGDLNGDGQPDLVVGTARPGGVAILLHYVTGFYPVLFHTAVVDTAGLSGHAVTDLKLVDLNKDGKLDAIVTLDGVGFVVMLGSGAGTFGNRTIYSFDPTVVVNPDAQVGDVNGDGWPDVVVEDETGTSVYVLLGSGGGALGAGVHYSMGPVVVQDATGDGTADLVHLTSSGVTIWPGNPAGTFNSSLPPVSLGLNPSTDAVGANNWGDLNGDPAPDLVYSWTSNTGQSNAAQHIGVLLGTGGGGFQAPVTYPSADSLEAVSQVQLGDIDGDGKTDVVTAHLPANLPSSGYSSTVEVDRGSGTGTLGAGLLYREPSVILGGRGALADLDEDGKLDLPVVLKDDWVTGTNEHCIAVIRNDGSGGFVQPALSAIGLQPTLPVIADFNHDGKPDLAVADLVSPIVKVAPGDGSGTFVSGSLASVPYPVASMTAGDFDRNGTMDLVTSDIYHPLQFVSDSPTGVLASPIAASPSNGYITHPRSMADMDRDGIPDLVVDAGAGQVAVLRGLGNGTFFPLTPQFLSVGSLNDLVLGDWNRDGYVDVAGATSAGLAVLLGGPGGTLTAPATEPWIGMNWTAVCAGDFNRDGILDLAARVSAVSSGDPQGIYVFLGDGSGNFTLGQTISPLDPRGYTIEATDVNHDGKLDLVTSGVFSGGGLFAPDAEAEVHLGKGDGTFDGIPYADGLIGTTNPQYGPCAVADVDRDGAPDVIAPMLTGSGIVEISATHIDSSSKGNGLLPASLYPTVTAPRSVAVGDLNRDGKLDVVTCTSGVTPGVAVHLGNGNGALGAMQAVAASGPATKTVIADFNRDGIPDVAALNNTTPPYGIATLSGTGDGTHFSLPHNYFFNAGADFAVGDLNRDGIPDIVTATPDSIRFLYGGPLPGTFSAGPGWALPGCSHIELADLNRDGILDVICACGSVKVIYGWPTPLPPPSPVTIPGSVTTCTTLCVADFNRDGFPDIEANQSGQWYIFWGAASSPFTTSAVSTLSFAPNALTEGDAEANGTPYLYAVRNPGQVEVLSVSPTGAIASVGSYAVGSQPGALALGDFNRDGGLDVVTANSADTTLAVNLHGAGLVTAVGTIAAAPPARTMLLQNYPNPFNPRTTIRYALSRAERIRLAVFDVRGRLVATLRDGAETAGQHVVSWDGHDSHGGALGSGVYFYRLTTESGERESKQLVLLK